MSVLVSFVVAMDRNRLIGANGGLPWRLPADMRFFKRVTLGHPILMGRLTWESLPRRPLPGRRNLVVTRQPDYLAPGAELAGDVSGALAMVDEGELMVIGGAQVFEALMTRVDRLYLTEVEGEFEGDTWFPAIDAAEWRETHAETHEPDEQNPHRMRFVTLDRLSASG